MDPVQRSMDAANLGDDDNMDDSHEDQSNSVHSAHEQQHPRYDPVSPADPRPSTSQGRGSQRQRDDYEETPMKRHYRSMAKKASAVLPILGAYTPEQVDPVKASEHATSLADNLKAGIDELYNMALSKAHLESRYQELYQALCSQRDVVRKFRSDCEQAHAQADAEYQQTLAPYLQAMDDSRSKDVHINRLETRITELQARVAQSEATIASKNAEIFCLNEKIKKYAALSSSIKGKSLMAPPNAQIPRRAVPPLRNDMMSVLHTPRSHN